MQPSHAVYLKIVQRVSLSKCKKAFEQSETIEIPPIATHPGRGSALASSDSRGVLGDTIFFREAAFRRTRPCYLRDTLRRCFCTRRSLLRRRLGRGPIGRTPHC